MAEEKLTAPVTLTSELNSTSKLDYPSAGDSLRTATHRRKVM